MTDIFLSPVLIANRTPLSQDEAIKALTNKGLIYITVNKDGTTVALSHETKPLHGMYVYPRD